MQRDMHYYGTYAIARAAGLKPKDAQVIAYSAQFVDDSTHLDSEIHNDGGMLYGIATAHHCAQSGKKYLLHKIKEVITHKKVGNIEQRRIWVPFHFYPGNQGSTFSEKLICRKNSQLVNEMFESYIEQAKGFPYILQLIGIASHVYMDTFSHYGFSGRSSRTNKVKADSFLFEEYKEEHIQHLSNFNKKWKKEYLTENWRNTSSWISSLSSLAHKIPILHGLIHWFINWKIKIISSGAEIGSGALGHGPVGELPDRPYLRWRFSYENRNEISERNNPQTYLEGCENLYLKLKKFSNLYYSSNQPVQNNFSTIEESIKEILSFYGDKDERAKKWIECIKRNKLFNVEDDESKFLSYNAEEWENQKMEKFHNLPTSSEVVNLPIYKFHQAADYHRHYTLKILLPQHGIIVN